MARSLREELCGRDRCSRPAVLRAVDESGAAVLLVCSEDEHWKDGFVWLMSEGREDVRLELRLVDHQLPWIQQWLGIFEDWRRRPR